MEKLEEPEEAGVDYDKYTFRGPLLSDLRAARQYVLMQSPFLKTQVIKPFLFEIGQCIRRGVVVCFFVCQPELWTLDWELLDPVTRAEYTELKGVIEMLISIGVHVNIRPDIHVKVAVLDGIISYLGSLNFFSYGKSTETTTRSTVAAKALNAIETHELFCDTCHPNKRHSANRVLVLTANMLFGDWLAQLRIHLRLGQRAMASRGGTNRSRLNDMEKGRAMVPLRFFIAFCHLAGLRVLVVPQYSVEAIKRLVASLPRRKT